ncbi:ABC transporter ATP-binding protein [Lysinibacillus antri]|uniref:ABC transporter ATP-binding protein n=1 Tax=Lysinibacillus antri TaxID=2498145 RepID=A0A3S0RH47_9BACI|nr:ABC transporter ATP-binding protein [Lysinibacillus antri]RUL47910.1 ABC transporter ATP-binding protein [Lysinibacillus antri]
MFYIDAKNLRKHFGNREVVKGVDLTIYQNEILAVIGPNGAGKSTTLEMLVGLKKSEGGKIEYWNNHFKFQLGVQLQSVPFFPGLTTKENLKIFGAFYKKNLSKEVINDLLVKCGLMESAQTEASKLSGGQQKRLAIAVALIHDPKLIFLDEPTAALDPRARHEIHQLIQKLHEDGKTIVFTSHDMDEVSKLAKRVIMIDDGRVIAEGRAKILCEQYNVSNLDDLYFKLTLKEEEKWLA